MNDTLNMTFDSDIKIIADRTIDHIAKTGTDGLVDTYTIYYTDGVTDTFEVTNGARGPQGETGNGIESVKLNDDYTLTLHFTDGTEHTTGPIRGEKGDKGNTGDTGNGIASVAKTKTEGLTDTYTITYTDGTTTTFTVKNGALSIDDTLTITGAAADAKAAGDRLEVAESDVQYITDAFLNNSYRKRTFGKEMEWENGGISSSGADNFNAYSIRTKGFLTFDDVQIAVQDPHTAYRCILHTYNQDGTYVRQNYKDNISSEHVFNLTSGCKFRIVLYNSTQDVRAVPDDFVLYNATIQKSILTEYIDEDLKYTGKTAQEGNYRRRVLGSRLLWTNGGISSSGSQTADTNSIFSEFVEFESDAVIAYDPAGEQYRISLVGYDKTTGSITEFFVKTNICTPTKIAMNPAYRYRVLLYNVAQTGRPTYNTLELYEYTDTIAKRKAEVKRDNKTAFRKRRPLVTIIDDDGRVEFYNRYFDSEGNYLLDAPICSAYEGMALGWTTFMTKKQLQKLVEAGGEILGHGYTPLAPERGAENPITIEEAEQDVIDNLRPLLDAGFEVGGYCYPYGATNTEVREMLAKYFPYACCGHKLLPNRQSKQYNDGCIPTYAITRAALFDDSTDELRPWSELEPLVQATVEHNGWLVFYMHAWRDTGETATVEAMNDVIAKIQEAGCEIVTASEGFEVFRNAWQAGDYLGPWNNCDDWSNIDLYETHTAADAGSAVNMLGDCDLKGAE